MSEMKQVLSDLIAWGDGVGFKIEKDSNLGWESMTVTRLADDAMIEYDLHDFRTPRDIDAFIQMIRRHFDEFDVGWYGDGPETPTPHSVKKWIRRHCKEDAKVHCVGALDGSEVRVFMGCDDSFKFSFETPMTARRAEAIVKFFESLEA